VNQGTEIREECVEFKNTAGHLLRGVLHRPDPDRANGLSLIFLNTGLNDMVGWHRIQVKMARRLAWSGCTVLRFDDSGIGGSEGEIELDSIVHVFSEIETGLFVGNADASVDFMCNMTPGDAVLFVGFCGGGLTAIHSAAKNGRVEGVVCVGGPVTLSSDDYLHKRDPWVVQQNIEKYRRKLFNLRAWVNFLTFRGEYKVVATSLLHYLKHKLKGEYSSVTEEEDITENASLNKTIFSSFRVYAKRQRPCLFFYADKDSATWEFKKYFLQTYKDCFADEKGLFEFVEAQDANHILSSEASQQLLFDSVVSWLGRHFCTDASRIASTAEVCRPAVQA